MSRTRSAIKPSPGLSNLPDPIKPNRLEVRYLPIASLSPAERNPRLHSDAQSALIARSITEFGFTNPILLAEHARIIAGHGRLAAAHKLGMREVPTIALTGLTAAQKRALVIADNQLALNASWCELSPAYIDVIVRRWEAYSGEKATLESSGETLETVALQRGIALDVAA